MLVDDINPVIYKIYGVGELPERTRPGDFVFVKSQNFGSKFIRMVDGGRYSHMAQVVGYNGEIVEAMRRGVVRANLSEWEYTEILYVQTNLNDMDREDAVRHANRVVGDGWKYDIPTFIGTGVFWATGGRLMVSGGAKSSICSALVADCQHAGGEYFPEAIPHFMTPHMMEKHYIPDGIE